MHAREPRRRCERSVIFIMDCAAKCKFDAVVPAAVDIAKELAFPPASASAVVTCFTLTCILTKISCAAPISKVTLPLSSSKLQTVGLHWVSITYC